MQEKEGGSWGGGGIGEGLFAAEVAAVWVGRGVYGRAAFVAFSVLLLMSYEYL